MAHSKQGQALKAGPGADRGRHPHCPSADPCWRTVESGGSPSAIVLQNFIIEVLCVCMNKDKSYSFPYQMGFNTKILKRN